MPTNSKTTIIQRIQKVVPQGSPEPTSPETLASLQQLTDELIQIYKAEGKLLDNPFTDVWNRTIHLYRSEVSGKLQGKVVLVTGGEGCVGSALTKELITLGAKGVVSVDKARCSDDLAQPQCYKKGAIAYYAADIRNYKALDRIFSLEQPDIIFHLAAQRLPGLAEVQVRETVTTGILGTQNIIQLCEKYSVQQCIFSSTGKASRYFTTEVYASTKKFSEWQFAQAAAKGNVTYGMVRFTHMLNNSSVCQSIENKVQQGKIVNIHAPDRYVTAQNISEAVHLLLNALVFSQLGKLKFLTVHNLGWPTETLEVALYQIIQSGKRIPIYIQGLQPGYEEPFFLGQFDWSKPTEIHLLLNALEFESRTVDASGDLLMAELAPFSLRTLTKNLVNIQKVLAKPNLPDDKIKQVLAVAQKEIVSSVFTWSSVSKLLKILKWGLNTKQLEAEGISIKKYQDIVGLLIRGMYGRLNKQALQSANLTTDDLDKLVEIVSALPTLKEEVTYLRTASRRSREFDCERTSSYVRLNSLISECQTSDRQHLQVQE